MPRANVHSTLTTTGYNSNRIRVARATYSFAVQGGAQGTIALTGQAFIPSGAIIFDGFIKQSATVPVGVGASIAVTVEGANDVVSAAAINGAPWSTSGIKTVVPVFATKTTWITTTAARDISIVVTSTDLSAGIFDVVLFYLDPLA